MRYKGKIGSMVVIAEEACCTLASTRTDLNDVPFASPLPVWIDANVMEERSWPGAHRGGAVYIRS